MSKYGGIPVQTLSDWITEESGFEGVRHNTSKLLKLPSGNTLRVSAINILDNNKYFVLEVSEWVAIIHKYALNNYTQVSCHDRVLQSGTCYLFLQDVRIDIVEIKLFLPHKY